MSFDWSKYSDLALNWKDSDKEELRRCSISRAYYSFYHAIKKFKGISVKKQLHSIVKDKLRESEIDDEIKLAHHLGNLQECRESADYDCFTDVSAKYIDAFYSRLEAANSLFQSIKS